MRALDDRCQSRTPNSQFGGLPEKESLMPTNLVATITKVITPELMARIASGLGLDQAAVQKAVTAGVPGLLAALTSLVAKPGGAEKTERRRRRPTTGNTHQHRQRHRRSWAEGSDRHRCWRSLFAPRRKHHIGAHQCGEQVCRDRRWRVEGAHGAPRAARDGRAGPAAAGERARCVGSDAAA